MRHVVEMTNDQKRDTEKDLMTGYSEGISWAFMVAKRIEACLAISP